MDRRPIPMGFNLSDRGSRQILRGTVVRKLRRAHEKLQHAQRLEFAVPPVEPVQINVALGKAGEHLLKAYQHLTKTFNEKVGLLFHRGHHIPRDEKKNFCEALYRFVHSTLRDGPHQNFIDPVQSEVPPYETLSKDQKYVADYDLKPGDLLRIYGPLGSGKTTALMHLANQNKNKRYLHIASGFEVTCEERSNAVMYPENVVQRISRDLSFTAPIWEDPDPESLGRFLNGEWSEQPFPLPLVVMSALQRAAAAKGVLERSFVPRFDERGAPLSAELREACFHATRVAMKLIRHPSQMMFSVCEDLFKNRANLCDFDAILIDDGQEGPFYRLMTRSNLKRRMYEGPGAIPIVIAENPHDVSDGKTSFSTIDKHSERKRFFQRTSEIHRLTRNFNESIVNWFVGNGPGAWRDRLEIRHSSAEQLRQAMLDILPYVTTSSTPYDIDEISDEDEVDADGEEEEGYYVL